MTTENKNGMTIHSFTFFDFERGADGLYDWFKTAGIKPKEIRVQSTLDADSAKEWTIVSCESELFSSFLSKVQLEHKDCRIKNDSPDDIGLCYILIR